MNWSCGGCGLFVVQKERPDGRGDGWCHRPSNRYWKSTHETSKGCQWWVPAGCLAAWQERAE